MTIEIRTQSKNLLLFPDFDWEDALVKADGDTVYSAIVDGALFPMMMQKYGFRIDEDKVLYGKTEIAQMRRMQKRDS